MAKLEEGRSRLMKTYLKEKIGNPDLFTGRKKELAFFLKWIEGIKKEISISTAILSRRKTGKTALLQRLYNLTFEQNDGVIPFYYEVKEGKLWAVEFCKDFFLTFLYQYIAYKTKKPEYITPPKDLKGSFTAAIDIARQAGLDYLSGDIRGIEAAFQREGVDEIWLMVRDAPLGIATRQHEFIVQIIDEFQYLNSEIYWDEGKTNLANDFAAGYMSIAEYRNAPLLISGSWIGWLRDLLHTMLPSRFRHYFLEGMPEDETVEMIYKYAQVFETPMTEEVVYAMARISEGNPFYVSELFQSTYPDKDFTTAEGMLKTLEYETLDERGRIRSVWLEYIAKVFDKVNQQHAKNIVLYLSKHRDRQVSRQEVIDKLELADMPELELEQKFRALVKSDVINQGRSLFFYQGVQDNIFDKVFRGIYADDIQAFDVTAIRNEYKALYEKAKADYQKLLGQFNQTKGLLAEFVIINQLRLHAFQQPDRFLSITHNLPEDFQFVEYEHVWSYKTARFDNFPNLL
ncbi:hypothetical protein U27_05555 [Candidatus Vecturithrix granuli]|uniref:ATPase domain-containing protein n=1 Tax=Vecturithrix granuli TaxID=1499967 RepID=A0A081C1X6_VECG1|nr:hypothetical protein U27_05555 [Candidatus Vecturithrix granuli]